MSSAGYNPFGQYWLLLGVLTLLTTTVWSACTPTSPFTPSSCSTQVRKDWNSLSAIEKNQFAEGFRRLSQTCQSNVPGNICNFACRYADALSNLRESNTLLYHKTLLLEIEATMKFLLGDGGFTIPYANFESVFSSPSLFAQTDLRPDADGISCVNWAGTPFAGILPSPPCTIRNYANPSKQVNEPDYQKARGSSKFNNFNQLITKGVQKVIHENYGGSMTTAAETNNPIFDPVFLLHQANIQRLLAEWQTQNPSAPFPSDVLDANVPQYTPPSSTLWNPTTGCITYGPSSYDPLQQVADGANSLFDFNFGGSFWGGGFKKRGPATALTTAISQLVPAGFGLQYLTGLADNNNLGYDLIHFLEGVYAESETGPLPANNGTTQQRVLLETVYPKIYYGIGFDYAVSFGVALQDFQTSSKGLWNLGAKFDQNRPNFIMAQILSVLRVQESLQDFTERVAQLFALAKHPENPADAPTQQELAQVGKSIITRFAGILSPATPLLSTSTAAPPEWKCPLQYYAAGDGCDCECGAVDPDCETPATFFSAETPVFGCWASSSSKCMNGTCVYGPAPPSNWSCPPERYNGTDGCDCNCGAQDPDCDYEYTGNQEEVAPYLYRAGGCTAGVGGVCLDGGCVYLREIPSNWTCPQEAYGSGGLCDCSCGAYDPDCGTNANIRGCGCSGLTCRNSLGLCEGQCTGATVKLLGTAPILCSAASSAPTEPPTEPPATCAKGNGKPQINNSFLELLTLTKQLQAS